MDTDQTEFSAAGPPTVPPIAVIGAGFSGTITALHLLRTLPPGVGVLLCERAASFGRGTAYSTLNRGHLLNVRAANMSAFADQPDGFETWLEAHAVECGEQVHTTDVGRFAPRALYGRYLAAMLYRGAAEPSARSRLQLVADEVLDIAPVPGGGYELMFGGGSPARRVSGVVLAIGNLPSSDADTAVYRSNAWAPGTLDGLKPGLPVLVVGTGLTTMDLVVSMYNSDFPGPVIALSRRGLLPQEHAAAKPVARPVFTPAERSSLMGLLRRVRREVARVEADGGSWRAVIDAMRPDTVDLWRGLTERDRARFLRHLRPFWDVHRHRLAPPSATLIRRLRESGYLQVVRGRWGGIEEDSDAEGGTVIVRPRNAPERRVRVQRVINATGTERASRCANTLLQNLLTRGLLRFDAQGLGMQVTDAFQVVDAEGSAASDLWALGPITRGVFWECTAVPDIRVQAERLAAGLARHLPSAAAAGAILADTMVSI